MPVTVAFTEMEGSPKETWTNEGFKATMRLLCAWSERNTLAVEVLRYGGKAYDRLSFTGARARSVTIEPFPAQVSQAEVVGFTQYEAAVVTIEFDTKGPEDDDMVTESWEPTVEFLTLPKEGFFWADSDTAGAVGTPATDAEAPGKIIYGGEYKITYGQLMAIPTQAYTLSGYVNKYDFTPYSIGNGKVFGAETLLFLPPVIERVWTMEQAKAWKMSYHFSWRQSGWNKFWRSKTGAWEPIRRMANIASPGSGYTPYSVYGVADFAPLDPFYAG
jgi:hypothetical protein